MALDTFAPPLRHAKGTKIDTAFRVKKAEFGDGYTQAMPDGINPVKDVIQLTWDTLLEEDALTIHNWLKSKMGTIPFYYDVDLGITRKWTCTAVGRGKNDVMSITATFEDYFGLET